MLTMLAEENHPATTAIPLRPPTRNEPAPGPHPDRLGPLGDFLARVGEEVAQPGEENHRASAPVPLRPSMRNEPATGLYPDPLGDLLARVGGGTRQGALSHSDEIIGVLRSMRRCEHERIGETGGYADGGGTTFIGGPGVVLVGLLVAR